jgi:hypothetical protein
MSLIMKSVLITAGLGLLFIMVEWNMMRKKKGGLAAEDKRNLRDLFLLTIGACALVAFAVANLT